MMRSNRILPEYRGKMMADALGKPPGVYKNQRGAMFLDEIRDPPIYLVPHFVRGNRTELTRRDFHRNVEFAPLRYFHNRGFRLIVSGKKLRDDFDRLLRGGKPDARGAASG